jgi:pimeloyl-ACP methyl ester carboxylesterase
VQRPTGATVTTWTPVGHRRVRAVEVPPPGDDPHGLVCVLPGLSLTGYVVPTACAVAARGLRCAVLDLPGLARRARAVAATPMAAGEMAARWLDQQTLSGRVVVLGHSTGAAAAVHAAASAAAPPALLVLAGPTFAPEHRRLRSLAMVAPRAYTRESPGELWPAARLVAHPGRVASIVRSGLQVRLEELVAGVTAPLVLTAGEADALAPAEWLDQLGRAARSTGRADCVTLPGSHNNLFTHPDEVADLVVRSLERHAPRRD